MAVRNISIHYTNYACDYWYERAITVFYDSLQPLYNHSHVHCWLCYMLFFIRKYGINNAYQEEIYKLFFKAEFESSKKYRWLEKPLIKKTLVSSTFAGCFVMGIIHFIEDDITQQRPRRRGGLIAFSYNYRVGVMFWEIVTTVFSIFPIFYFGLLFLYIINYFFRGLGTGKVVVLEKTSNPKFRSSNK